MPKDFIKRYLPSKEEISANKALSFLGKVLHDGQLWHLHRRSVALAFLVGLFWAFIPMPFQMVPAAVCSVIIRCNLPIAVALVWITNPITLIPIFYFNYKFGAYLLDIPAQQSESALTFDWFVDQLSAIWLPLYFGSLILAITFGIIGFISVRIIWRWHVARNWSQRQIRRKNKQH